MKGGNWLPFHRCFARHAHSDICGRLVSILRVAITPAVTATLAKKGFTVNIEPGAGIEARFRNDDYTAAGAKLVDRDAVYHSG